MSKRNLRDSDVHFAPDQEGDFEDNGEQAGEDAAAGPGSAEGLGGLDPDDALDVDDLPPRGEAEEEEEEDELEDVPVPEEPTDPNDPVYLAALAKYRAAAEHKRKRHDRIKARRQLIKQGKAEAMRDLRRRTLADAQKTWWGYLDFGGMIDRAKNKIMPRAQRKLVRSLFGYWVELFEDGWETWSEISFTLTSMFITVGIPMYLVFFQRGFFYDWFASNHRPDVAMIKPRTRR